MDLFQLLNKNDALDVEIIRILLSTGTEVSENTLLETLKVSKFTLTAALNDLQQTITKSNIDAELILTRVKSETFIKLNKADATDIGALYYQYLTQSVEYQILHTLFEKQSFTRQHLIKDLAISEGAVYRYLHHLNELLEEFSLKIRNGQLVGNELQITYFYYELIWNLSPVEEIRQYTNHHRIQNAITALEQSVNTPFSVNTRTKIGLWLYILQKRSALELTDNEISNKLLCEISKDPLFEKVRTVYFRFTLTTAKSGSDYKSVYLYLFLISMFIFDIDNNFVFSGDSVWPTPLSKIRDMAEWIVNFINRHLAVDIQDLPANFILRWRSILTQLLTQIYFFQGNIAFITTDTTNTQLPEHINDLIQPIIKKVLTDYRKPELSATMKIYSNSILENYIESSRQFARHHLQVGIFSRKDYFTNHYLIEQFIKEFGTSFNINVEIAVPSRKYDLIVTDAPVAILKYHYVEKYVLTGRLNTLDRKMLAIIMNNITERVD